MQKRFPVLERELEEVVTKYVIEVGDHYSPVMSQVRTHRLFEGNASSMLRETGEQEETEIRSFSATLEIPSRTILHGTVDELFDFFTPIGKQMVADKERLMLETVHVATEKTGNIVSAEGKPLTIEKLLELLEIMQIDFDESGMAIMPTLLGSSKLISEYERLRRAPENQRAFDDLIRQKKAEWLAREADRTLVG